MESGKNKDKIQIINDNNTRYVSSYLCVILANTTYNILVYVLELDNMVVRFCNLRTMKRFLVGNC